MIFQNRFQDKTVLVTGAAQGIGKGVALRIAAEGAKVILVDRSSPCTGGLTGYFEPGFKGCSR